MPTTPASCGKAQRTLGRLWSLQRYVIRICRLHTYQREPLLCPVRLLRGAVSCSIGTMAKVNLLVRCCSPCIIPTLSPPHQLFSFLRACTPGCTHSVLRSTAEGLQEWLGCVFTALEQLQAQVATPDILRCNVGKDSLDKDPSFLSIEQALADYAALIYHLKEKYKAEGSPVIAFGGSYGGMLAAWLRAKYPNAVQVTHTIAGYTDCSPSGLA